MKTRFVDFPGSRSREIYQFLYIIKDIVLILGHAAIRRANYELERLFSQYFDLKLENTTRESEKLNRVPIYKPKIKGVRRERRPAKRSTAQRLDTLTVYYGDFMSG